MKDIMAKDGTMSTTYYRTTMASPIGTLTIVANDRAVGAANGKNPIPIIVPCHRVVGSNGHLTGFAGGLEAKAWLLDHEFKVRAAATDRA